MHFSRKFTELTLHFVINGPSFYLQPVKLKVKVKIYMHKKVFNFIIETTQFAKNFVSLSNIFFVGCGSIL